MRLAFADEKVREHEPASNPDVTDSEKDARFVVFTLRALIQMKRTAYRDKDRALRRDLIKRA